MTPEERRETLNRIALRIEDGMMVEEATRAEGITGTTLRNWVREDSDLGRQLLATYARAREAAADQLAERAVRIATGDEPVKEGTDRRLAYDALRWLAGKRRPKEYGDKQSIEVSGGIEHLHLDALRSISAKARIDNSLPTTTSPKLLSVTSLDAQPIDTVQDVDTE